MHISKIVSVFFNINIILASEYLTPIHNNNFQKTSYNNQIIQKKLTISANLSKNGIILRSSVSPRFSNQLSIGIPLSSWYLRIKSHKKYVSYKKPTKYLPKSLWGVINDYCLRQIPSKYCQILNVIVVNKDTMFSKQSISVTNKLVNILQNKKQFYPLDPLPLRIQKIQQLVSVYPLRGSKKYDFEYL